MPEPTPDEITFLLDTVNTALATRLTHADVIGSYAGLRPLIDNGAGHTADVSRDHAVIESDSGMFSIVGGKLTEYRYMAEDAVDRAVAVDVVAGLAATGVAAVGRERLAAQAGVVDVNAPEGAPLSK